jgi:hypothetical protein
VHQSCSPERLYDFGSNVQNFKERQTETVLFNNSQSHREREGGRVGERREGERQTETQADIKKGRKEDRRDTETQKQRDKEKERDSET